MGLLLLQSTLYAMECRAKIANRTFSIKLTEKMGVPFLEVENDTGTNYQGPVSKYFSSSSNVDLYHLTISNRRPPIEIEIDRKGDNAVTFCLEPNTCTYCR